VVSEVGTVQIKKGISNKFRNKAKESEVIIGPTASRLLELLEITHKDQLRII
jgi:hypothetical protein